MMEALVMVVMTWSLVPIACGQAEPVLSAPSAAAGNPAQSLSEDVYTNTLVVTAGILLLAFGVACLELRGLQRKREEEAVQLETQIGDALLRDRILARLPIAPTVYIPLRRRAGATVELHGQVPTVELRQAALSVADRETSRFLNAYRIQDHIQIRTRVGAPAA
jgi:hypothetical protein